MKYAEKIKKKLCKEIDEIGERNDLRASDIEMLYKMTDIVKNIDKIEMLEEGGEEMSERRGRISYRGGSSYEGGSYEGGSYEGDSYARRRGRSSYGEGSYDVDMSMARGRRGRNQYSRSEAKDEMMSKLGHMMKEADSDERKILEKAMRQIEELED